MVGIFPEAGISYSYTVRALMPGVAALARETGAPVVPASQWGIQRVWSVGRAVAGTQAPAQPAPGPPQRPGRSARRCTSRPTPTSRPGPPSSGACSPGCSRSCRRGRTCVPAPGEHAPWYPAHLGGHAPDRREALTLDDVPRAAIAPTWGPPLPPEQR